MRIGVDISQTGSLKAGCGYFADSLIHALADLDNVNQYMLYRTFGDFYWDSNFKKIKGVNQQNFIWGKQHSTLNAAQYFWQQPPHIIEKELGSPDILHVNNYFFPRKKLPATKLVYTLYDLSFIENPEWTTEQNRFLCFDNVFNASLWADHIIAISEYSKKHFLETFPHYCEKKITVIPLASRYTYNPGLKKPENYNLLKEEKFWLSVGTIEPRKNYKFLLQAYARLKAQRKTANKEIFPLILVGGMGWRMEDFEHFLLELGLKEDVVWLGYINEESLQWLYQHCKCFIYPSLFEGFGLPVLEAMSCGASVITSATSSIPEVTGKEAAVLIDPTQVDMLVDKMNACQEGQFNLREKALERSKNFSWKKNAEKLLTVYDTLK